MTKRLARQLRASTVEELFQQAPVLDLEEITHAIGTSSRTVCRYLSKLRYLSSYSHAGRYYTLAHVPRFDAHGIWAHQEVRFSRHGTLRATVVVLVREAPEGRTQEELKVILGLRVHDTLRSLVREGLLARQRVEAVYLYTAPDPERTAAQLEQRRRPRAPRPEPEALGPPPPLDLARVVDVLLAVIHGPKDDAPTIAARLRLGGSGVTDEQVEAVFAQYGLGKKTAPSRSQRSRR
jgi:hypothetical protein